MVLLLTLSALLLIAAAGLVFGLPYLLFGQRAFDGFTERPEYRVMGGLIATATLALVCAPIVTAGLISSGETALMFADNLVGLNWSL